MKYNLNFKRRLLFSILTAILGFSASVPAFAKKLKGVKMENEITLDNKKLVLNGMGIRKAFGFYSVYVGTLYLEAPQSDEKIILDSKEPKKLILSFIETVPKEKITEKWEEGLKKNCKAPCEKSVKAIDSVNTKMAEMKPKDTMEFIVRGNSVEVIVKGQNKGSVEAENFGRDFMAIFIGEFPPNKDLKEGLLGKVKLED